MANTVDSTSLAPALKRYYTPKRVQSLIFNDAPLLAKLPKAEDWCGEVTVVPIRVSEAQLASSSIAQAATNSTRATAIPNLATFHMTVIEGHAWATVSHKILMQTRNDKGAFFEAGKMASEDAMVSLKKQISHGLYRAGWGKIGTIAAGGVSGAVVTLTNIDDVVAFYKGLEVQFSASEASDVLRDSGDSLIVASVDRDLGTVTFSTNVSNVSGATAGDSIFIKGNREDSATPTRLAVAGLEAWLPAVAPASTSFFNVDRTSDSLLSGCRVAGSLTSIEDSLVDGALQVARRGGKIDAYYMSFGTFGAILKNASGQVVRDTAKAQDLSFEALSLNTPKGKVQLIPDYSCPDGVAYGLQHSTWTIGSYGNLIGQFDADGNDSLRLSDSNGLQMRFYSFHNLNCNAPGFNVRVALS